MPTFLQIITRFKILDTEESHSVSSDCLSDRVGL